LYVIPCPEPYTISYENAMRASREFDDHCCDNFPQRKEAA